MLLPHVHELASQISKDAHFEVLPSYSFWLKNPPLYFAGALVDGFARHCACIATLRPLLTGVGCAKQLKYFDVANTQVAAQMVAEGGCDVCITNEAGTTRYGLQRIVELKPMNVYWIAMKGVTER